MHEKKAKIVCFVPSWTETLIEAGLNVIGRTRFCIHPAEKVGSIKVVGGTKNIKIDEIIALNPDFVVLDKEENKKEMAEALQKAGIEILVSHVSCLRTAADFLSILATKFSSAQLADFADQYRMILANKTQLSREKFLTEVVLQKNTEIDFARPEYVIWKNPYMVIGAKTFISEVLGLFDIELSRVEKYPKVLPEELIKKYCFFSSEPYPFSREFSALTEQGFKGVLVDGEKISWYGVRNLRFLKACLE